MEIAKLPLDGIRTNGGTQPRVETNNAAIEDYADVLRAGGELPPVVVFDDGAELWLADGFHRFHAHRAAAATEIQCDVRQGTKRDAVLFSVGANAAHGLRRSNEDKRKAVMTLLSDAEWSTWSDNAIAKACAVSNHMVSDTRKSILEKSKIELVKTVERNGKVYEQNTANIGKKPLYRQDESIPEIRVDRPENAISADPALEMCDDFGPSDSEVADAIKADADQLEYIKSLLNSDEDPLSIALADIKKLRSEIEILKWSRDGHQNKCNELMRMVKSLQAKIKKMERAA